MTKRRSHNSNPSETSESDDLKLIDGIGPAVEKRLHRIGILTFAQLSTFSPADIAAAVTDIAGLSTERIIKQDWIGQARKLALQTTSTKMMKETDAPAKVLTIDSSTNLIKMNKPQIVLSDTHAAQNMLHVGQPYEVQFTLLITNEVTSPKLILNYTALVFGRNVDQWVRYPMGVAQGTIKPSEKITITIRGASLPQGTYWLEAETITSHPPATQQTSSKRELQTTVKGHLFEIY
jgi:hypothetical protein